MASFASEPVEDTPIASIRSAWRLDIASAICFSTPLMDLSIPSMWIWSVFISPLIVSIISSFDLPSILFQISGSAVRVSRVANIADRMFFKPFISEVRPSSARYTARNCLSSSSSLSRSRACRLVLPCFAEPAKIRSLICVREYFVAFSMQSLRATVTGAHIAATASVVQLYFST